MISRNCIKKALSVALICVMLLYYYLYTLLPHLTALLPFILIVGIVLSGAVIIDTLLTNSESQRYARYVSVYIILLGISVILQWPNVAWLVAASVALLALSRDEFIKVFFYGSVALYSLVIIMALLGYLPMVYVGFDGAESERYGMTKYTLGFDGPNQASLSFFALLLSGMYLYGKSRAFTLAALVLCCVVGIMTGSRTGFLVSLIFVLVFRYMMIARPAYKKPVFLQHLFWVGFVVSCVLAVLLTDSSIANRLLSDRPMLVNDYLHSSYVPSLLGTDEVYNKAAYQTPPLDNFPVYIFARYGAVGFLGLAYIFWAGMRRERDVRIHVVFVFIMIYGLSEAFFDIPAKNFVLPILITTVLCQKGVINGDKPSTTS